MNKIFGQASGIISQCPQRRPRAANAVVRGLVPALVVFALALAAAAPARAGSKLDIAKELDCLAVNIYWEAAFEPDAGKFGVAHTTVNRRNDPRWPDTICGVVFEPKAFSWTVTHPKRRPCKSDKCQTAWEQSRIVANKVYYGLDKGRDLWRGVTYYHADYVHKKVQKAWQRRLVEYLQVGRHIFYRPSYKDIKG